MHNVSQAYKDQINKPMRNPQHIHIIIFGNDYNRFTKSGTIVFEINTNNPNTDIMFLDSNWTNEVEPAGRKLPQETFSFTFLDIHKQYNPEIVKGEWAKIERQLPVFWEYGYELDDGSIEWIPGSVYLTTGQNDWQGDSRFGKVTINAQSVIGYLSNEDASYDETSVNYYNIVVNNLANSSLFAFTNGWFGWNISTTLQDFDYSTLQSKVLPINQMLQLIAQASGCVLKTDRSGNISMQPFIKGIQNYFRLDFNKIMTLPTVTRYPVLSELSTAFTEVVAGNAMTIPENGMGIDLGTGTNARHVNFAVWPDVLANFYGYRDPAALGNFIKNNLPFYFKQRFTTVDSYLNLEIYEGYRRTMANPYIQTITPNSYFTNLRIINEKTFEVDIKIDLYEANPLYMDRVFMALGFNIRGNPIVESTDIATTVSSDTEGIGERVSVENPFISSPENADILLRNIEYFLTMRNLYGTVQNRGFPEVDAGDTIFFQSTHNFHFPALVLANNINFNGTFGGNAKLLSSDIDEDDIFGLLAKGDQMLSTNTNNGLPLDWRGE